MNDTMYHMELLSRLQNGDETAFVEMFRLFYQELFTHALVLLKDKEAAEDAVHDVFFYLLANDVHLSKNLKGYLHTSVHNRCLQFIRKGKVQLRYNENISPDQSTLPDLDLEKDATQVLIHKLKLELQDLAPAQRAAFDLVYCKQKKYKEAALTLGISLNSLKTNLRFALIHLRKRMV